MRAVPVIAATAAAPAMAASTTCKPSLGYAARLDYIVPNTSQPSTQQLTLGLDNTRVSGLPTGVTVTSITYQFWIQNRIGQDSPGPGAFFMANRTASTSTSKGGTCASAGCTVTWSPTAGSGFSDQIRNTANLSSQVYPDGQTRQSWDVNMRWDATRDSNLASRYSTGSGGCTVFNSGPTSLFNITYTGVKVPTKEQIAAGSGEVAAYVLITATLSNGQVLTSRVQRTATYIS